ncbi:MAG: hypothetical protein V1792_03635 [Pseudomonadota bacterium]
MSVAPLFDSIEDLDPEAREILADPDVRASWEALDDPEDRGDLIDHLKALRRLKEGKDELIPWEEARKRLGWT